MWQDLHYKFPCFDQLQLYLDMEKASNRICEFIGWENSTFKYYLQPLQLFITLGTMIEAFMPQTRAPLGGTTPGP